MAETKPKRPREESNDSEGDFQKEDSKRHQSYNHILPIPEQEEDDSNQDLLDIFISLQQELSSDSTAGETLQCFASPEADPDRQAGGGPDEEEDDRIRMMRHLLEASDDELGIPNRVESGDDGNDCGDGGDGDERLGDLGDGLWEFEDEAANYYAFLQSELFM